METAMYKFLIVLFVAYSLTLGAVHIPIAKWPILPSGPQARIVGGQTVNITEIPYQASLLHYGRHHCGAIIVNRNYVLTAAHCFQYIYDKSQVQIRVGSNNIRSGGIVVDVDSYKLHDKYNVKTLDYDVAMVKLAYPLPLDDNIKPAKLAEKGFSAKTGSIVTVSGWGRLQYQGPLPRALQKVDLQIIDRTECYIAHAEYAEISERQLCAAVKDGGKDACNGDSGGPLTQEGVVVGLVSWGVDCADPQWPRIYSNISFFREWINSESRKVES